MAFLWLSKNGHFSNFGTIALKGRIFIRWLGKRPSFSPVIVNKRYVATIALYSQMGALVTKPTQGEGQNWGRWSFSSHCAVHKGALSLKFLLLEMHFLLKVDWVRISATCTGSILTETCRYTYSKDTYGNRNLRHTVGPPWNSGTPFGITRRAVCVGLTDTGR